MKAFEIDAFEILDRITDAFFAVDRDWNFTYINAEASRLLKRRQSDLIGKNVWVEFPEAIDAPFYHEYQRAVNTQTVVQFDAYYPPPLDMWYDVRAYPSENGLTVYFKDITKQRISILKTQQHYQSLFMYNPDCVFCMDLEGNYLSVNPAMVNILGYTEEEFLSKSYRPLAYEEDYEKMTYHFTQATLGKAQNYDSRGYHKDGRILHFNITNIPIIIDGNVIGVYGIAKDITKHKETEEYLIKSEKLSAVGQISASIAHEIRNPLTSIKGFIQLMQSSQENLNPIYLDVMSKEITRIEMITGDLLYLAKPQAQVFKLDNLQEIIEDIIVLLNSQAMMNNITIKASYANIPKIMCSRNQLKQVFVNIFKNAIEAMPKGGSILIDTQVSIDQKDIIMTISDEGCGIPKPLLEKIGQPFYSTKEKGTGLGMMTTFKIIEEHQGTVHIDSEVHKGTTVKIKLPAAH